MPHEQRNIVAMLAATLADTRAEIDGMRTVLISAIATICANPHSEALFAVKLRAAKEGDASVVLASSMPDAFLQQRSDWIDCLVPPRVRAAIRQP